MTVLRQSTEIKVRIGPFVDVSDGFTPETGITLSGADEAELLKANGAATADISGATWAAVTGADGWFDLTLTASHTDTVGELVVVVHDDSVCLPVFCRFQVIEEAAYDALYAASAVGPLLANDDGSNLTEAGGDGDHLTEAGGTGDQLTALATAANLATAQADLDTMTGTDGATLATTQGNYAPAKAGDEMGLVDGVLTDAKLAGNLEIVFETDFATNYNTTRNAWATNVQDTVGSGTLGLTIPTAANIVDEWETQSQADPTGFQVNVAEFAGIAQTPADVGGSLGDLSNRLGTPVDFGSGADFAFMLQDMAGATFSTATDSLESIRDHIGDGTNLTEAGGTGDQFTAIVWNANWDAEVESEVNDALVALHLDHLFAATYDPASKPGAADALFNELIESDGGVSRYTANALEQAPSGGASVGDIADAVWTEAIADHSGTSGSTAEALAAVSGATPSDDEDLTDASSFYFTSGSQTTSPHTINRVVGFDGPLQFDFSRDDLFGDDVIGSNTTPTVTRTAGSGADPTIDNVRYDATKKKLMFDLDASSAAAGTFTITASVTKGSTTVLKKGTFELEATS